MSAFYYFSFANRLYNLSNADFLHTKIGQSIGFDSTSRLEQILPTPDSNINSEYFQWDSQVYTVLSGKLFNEF